MKFQKLALVAMTTMVLAACGGDGEVKPFIKGVVNGTSFQATEDLGGHYHGSNTILHIWGDVVQAGDSVAGWDLEVPAAVGTYPCGPVGEDGDLVDIELWDERNGASLYYYADGEDGSSCSVTVTRVGEKEVAGTFTATLGQDTDGGAGSATVKVTKGSFRVPFDPND